MKANSQSVRLQLFGASIRTVCHSRIQPLESCKVDMSRTKKLRGDCIHCGMPIDFPAEMIGTSIPCPHCKKNTELFLTQPLNTPVIPRKVLLWTVITLLILVAGFLGSLAALNRAKRMADERSAPAKSSPPPAAR